MPSWTKAIEKLSELGFSISGMFPVARQRGFQIMEFDGVFINRAIAERF